MKFDDLKFEAVGCCGSHQVATCDVVDGLLSITEADDQTYTVEVLNEEGLVSRQAGLSKDQVEALLPKT